MTERRVGHALSCPINRRFQTGAAPCRNPARPGRARDRACAAPASLRCACVMDSARPIAIYVDADACPVKPEIYKVAERHRLHVFVVANSFMMVPRETFARAAAC